MPLMFGPHDLDAQAAMRMAFDPLEIANTFKVLPSPSSCGDAHNIGEGMWV
jgi:hypothetical protein